jgi:DNA polymerase III delta prime subunit
MMEQFIWSEKFRPKTLQTCILPATLKSTFQSFVEQMDLPNLLLTGPAGVGKTTVAKALLNQMDRDCYMINGSMSGNIDTLRNEISSFASSVSFLGGRKYVILDEADHLNPTSFQPALRGFMEEFAGNCGFILTCNFPNKIIEPLRSRLSVIEFRIPKDERPAIASQYMKRVMHMLDEENIPYDKKVVAQLITHHFPDLRRVINELQSYSASGRIDEGVLAFASDKKYNELITALKEKDFKAMREWVVENYDSDAGFYRQFYDSLNDYLQPTSIPVAIDLIASYMYKHAFVADPEINLVAFLTNIMLEVEFK